MVRIEPGDIVKHEESPCEVLTRGDYANNEFLFIMNKRTLNASFVKPNECEFVRRPEKRKSKK